VESSLTQSNFKKIIHADMDAFYASVEIRENPELAGKPVVVGGSPNSRGVVCAASYEARKYGVKSAIPCSQAKRLCPEAIFIPPNFTLYKKVSSEVNEIFHEYTDLVEPLSLDEAFLDVTMNKINEPLATKIAEEIKYKVKSKTHLTISCGVSYNKFLAKIASDWKKPDGLFVIRPTDAFQFLENLDIGRFYGVGKVTEKKMRSMGIQTGRDLLPFSKAEMEAKFGKNGLFYYDIVRGIDNRLVNPSRARKSLGIEDTFSVDTADEEFLLKYLETISKSLYDKLVAKDIYGKSLTVKLKYSDFTVRSSTRTVSYWLRTQGEMLAIAKELFLQSWNGRDSIRLLGVSISNFEKSQNDFEEQPLLFK
jgi:DNA polymerase-4